ncbi:MAG TPA: metal-sulfur cluster assembly factor [Trueperaceae bacterium]|nr:metal-sulfur cluster assembly factor [Trueperaceae bacterium]
MSQIIATELKEGNWMVTTDLKEDGAAVPASAVLERLEQVIDPELGLDIVNLGMVYEVFVTGADVAIQMTLTTPGCPLHASIEEQVRARVGELDGVGSIAVTLVWDPPWTPMSMSQAAKRALGF